MARSCLTNFSTALPPSYFSFVTLHEEHNLDSEEKSPIASRFCTLKATPEQSDPDENVPLAGWREESQSC